MIVVSDTSPINYLVLIGSEDILPRLFGVVVVPATVMAELAHPDSPEIVRRFANAPPTWLEVHSDSPSIQMFPPELGPGEVTAIRLARTLGADRLLIDDALGRAFAEGEGFDAMGTLGVLQLAAVAGYLHFEERIQRLRKTNFRVGATLTARLLEQERERLRRQK